MRNLRGLAVVVTSVGLLSGFALGASTTHRAAAQSAQRETLVHNGLTRSYVVRLPREAAQRNRRLPLVLMLHGGGGNAGNAETMSGFTEKGRKEGFIVVYPEGTSRLKDRLLTWNAGHCCGYAMQNRVDDVGFMNALIDRLIADYPVDANRIYVTGMSNGGMMSHRLGIELSNRVAAIAPVVATLFGDEKRPEHPVSALMINGLLDTSVPHQGGPPGGRASGAWDGTPTMPAAEQGAFWARANGCTSAPVTVDRGSYVRSQYRCPAGRSVESVLVEDSGHAWPGGQAGRRRADTPSAALSATDVIWEFFKAHTR